MDISFLALLGVAVMFLALLLVPLGLPGVWIMMTVVAAATLAGEIGVGTFFFLLALAAMAEVAEFLAVDRLGRRYGGSGRTLWGALLGGLAGAFVGAPVPVVGPFLGMLFGTLAGATLATWHESRQAAGALRAGWGALLGRALAVAVKIIAGLVILIIGGAALLFD